MSKRFLILCSNEINYNPRLLKAADFLAAHGEEVTVFNSVTGLSSYELYQDVIRQRPWKVIENRIDKRIFSSRLRWLYCSLVNKIVRWSWKVLKWKAGAEYYMQKGLITAKIDAREYDFIVIHLIDSLPFAVRLKRKNPSLKIIYDSQEYFRGQYEHAAADTKRWVYAMEQKYIEEADLVLATTEVMKQRILQDYKIRIPMFRLRNVPYRPLELKTASLKKEEVLNVVWHGMTIIYGNRRGLHTIVHALAHCNTPVHLHLQGLKREKDMQLLKAELEKFRISDQVTIHPPAHPDRIVESLLSYDVGICAEIPEEENQQLTSSNKLFEYLGAGLCAVVSDVPGLTETLNEFEVGMTFKAGDAQELALTLDRLNSDRELLMKYQNNARMAAKKELHWQYDYDPVYQAIIKLK